MASQTSTIYFITGSDESAVKKAAVTLAAELAPGADAFGLDMIDGAVDTVDAAGERSTRRRRRCSRCRFLGARSWSG